MAAVPVPPDLKAIAPYLARANELATASPVIAYWCNYYAVQKAMTLGSKAPEANVFLFSLMDKLELMKEQMSDNEAVTDDAAAAAFVENFAIKIFGQADEEDRNGKSSRLTAKKFLAGANFLELLSVFGDISSENRDKIKYSKWKAADIAKAFREGRTPVPGPAGGLPEEEEFISADQITSEESKDLARELANLTALDGAPSKEEPEDEGPSTYNFPQQPTTLPSAPPAPEVEDEHPQTPGFPSFLNTPTTFPGFDDPTPSPPPLAIPPSHQTQTLAPPPDSSIPAFPAAVFPAPPPLPSALPPPPTTSYFPPPTIPSPAPPMQAPIAISVPPPMPATESLDPMVIARIVKHAKWAISALNYEDAETARKELRAALMLLGG